ncbi:rab effector MyRIP isoform X2 [Sebastes umbrosus]|uniref:rab effector MyRIP isoform X2 n=1 Tax=Sebastes umbrosus TaxID=72105 RepID=UPI0018A0AFDC|nr:rab effector MyRIP isoform X2 [Sebastes umbrosus]
MGRKLDLSGLSENEAEHVLQVVQRDMRLRKTEEHRLSELKQELDEEGSRCLLLSRQSCFNQRCCIRCCSPFTFLLNPKRQCHDCHYNVCKACRVYNKRDKTWLCSACQKSRLLTTQSLEWFYTNLKTRFKRFGSAKVLKTLYRKHLAEHSVLSELTESSAYEESICNEGSFCGSDSTFYRQTQEHSVAETITVALRVAEEAIDEAISKAEFDTASQEKQNEARYLREHRGELIEELSKTIVQKIISRRKTLYEIRTDYDQDWPLEHNTDLHRHHQSDYDQASSSLKHQPDFWMSHTGLSLLDNDLPGLIQDSSLKKDGGGSAWKSVDRLDNAVLKSPDGNWIALQSAQLSRPSLLTRRKSLVFSVLEKESEVVSAYEGMNSDNETKPKPDAHDGIPSPLTSSTDNLFSDSEGNWKSNKSLLAVFKRKVPAEIGLPSPSCRTSIIDVNFNVGGAGEEEESKVAAKPDVRKVRRSRKKRRSKKELSSSVDYSEKDNHSQNPSDATTPDTLTSGGTTPEPFQLESDITGHVANQMEQEVTLNLQQLEEVDGEARDAGDNGRREEKRRGTEGRDEEVESRWRMEIDLDEGRTDEDEEVDEEMKYRLYRLIAQSRLTYLSTDDDLDKDGQSEEEWEGDRDEDTEEEKTDGLTSKLCRLEKQVRANMFSSTEDELDRVGLTDEEKTGEDEEEELAVKVCRLANQANATQYSSTEDELDRAGRGEEGEEAIDEGKLWKRQEDKETRASQLCDLASLVRGSQFSSTEDELDRVGVNEVEVEQEINEGGIEREEAMGKNPERRESFGDLDVEMFDLRDEIEERKTKVVQDKTEVKEKKESTEEIVTDEDKRMVKGHMCEEKVELLKEAKKEKETEARQEIISLHEPKVQRGYQPEAKWPNKEEGEERQEEGKIRESEESQDIAADSDEENAEFDRVISGMLMMTLEDMQVETLRDEAAKNGSKNREAEEVETDVTTGGFKDNAVDAQSKNASKDTGSAKEFQSRGDNVMPESAVRERPGENARDISRKEESGDATGGDEKERQEKDTDAQVKKFDIEETKLTCKRIEKDDDEQEERKVTTEWKMMETQGGAAEGDCERNERLEETKEENTADTEQNSTSSLQEGLLSPEDIQNRYSAVSLRSITTEVLKVLNATEELLLLQGAEGGDGPRLSNTSLPPNTDPKKLDQQFCRLEENVYMTAGEVYGLEAELSDLETCARGICSNTSDMELSFLEEQVASAAAKVQQSELQVCDISARIAALKSAGLNVETQQSRFTKTKTIPFMPFTVDSSRQRRRRLPAPPVKEDKEEI